MKEKEKHKEPKPIKMKDIYQELAEMKAIASGLLRRIKRLRNHIGGV